jgi:hypothetical protein
MGPNNVREISARFCGNSAGLKDGSKYSTNHGLYLRHVYDFGTADFGAAS